MKTNANSSHKLTAIEGLRGYLALCVLLSHVLQSTGYDKSSGQLKDIGGLAVQCFMIISGFVIFLLLDSRHEPYRVFISRRFFRIFPVYILLFIVSIPCLLLTESNLIKSAGLGWFNPQELASTLAGFNSMWQNINFHVPLHLLLFQGLIPERVLPGSATAFLGPAWSLSLEWQFYLLAPLWFFVATSQAIWKRLFMYAVCVVAIVGSRRFLPSVGQEAALPFHVEHFFFGLVCYLLYRTLKNVKIKEDAIFPVIFIMGLAVYKWSGRGGEIIPFLVWSFLFALLIEPPSSISSRYISPIFTNRISAWLGKISYSMYLSHALVIIVVKWWLLATFPTATQTQHLMMLLPLTLSFTILLSAILFYGVEAPFMKFGKYLTNSNSEKSFNPSSLR